MKHWLVALGVLLAPAWAAEKASPDTVVRINGQAYTAKEVEQLVDTLSDVDRKLAKTSLRSVLEQYGLKQKLAEEAVKNKLDEKNPYRDELVFWRAELLAGGVREKLAQQVDLSRPALQKFLAAHPQDFEQLRFKVLYVASSPLRTDEQAKERVQTIQQKLQQGTDFVALIREYSDAKNSRARDGDWSRPITRDAQISGAGDIVAQLFTFPVGQVRGPVKGDTGYYLLRVEARNVAPLEQVEADVRRRAEKAAVDAKVAPLRQQVKVEVIKVAEKDAGNRDTTPAGVVDGRKLTQEDLARFLSLLPPDMQDQQTALTEYGLIYRLAAQAEKEKLAEQSPYKERLASRRLDILAQAQMDEETVANPPSMDDAKVQYARRPQDFERIKARGIFIGFNTGADSKQQRLRAEAQVMAQSIADRARAGADFLSLVKESEDPETREKGGDFGTIRRTDNIRDDLKLALFKLQAGQISDPILQPTGYYVFRIEQHDIMPYDEVKDALYQELKQEVFRRAMESYRQKVKFEVVQESFFRQAPSGAAASGARFQ